MSDEQHRIKKCEHGYPKSMWCPKCKGERSLAGETGSGLSKGAQHAYETIHFALADGDPTLTAEEVRVMIGRLYGLEVDKELRAMLRPNTSGSATRFARSL